MARPGERHHPFFDPLWRRIAVVIIVALWFAFELIVTRQSLWMSIAGAMTLYAVYTFLIAWPKPKDSDGGDPLSPNGGEG